MKEIAGDERLCVVSGFRRIAACRFLGWDRIPVRHVPTTFDTWQCALWAAGENAGQRTLNPVETGRIYRLLRHNAPTDAQLRRALRAMGLPDNLKAERRFAALCELPESVQMAVAWGTVAMSTADVLSGQDTETAEALSSLIQELRLGVNKQREVVELVLEIARSERQKPAAILAEPVFSAILKDSQGDRAHRSHRLRDELRHRRFPNLTRAEAQFEVLRRRIPLAADAELFPPPGFEGRAYRLSLSFSSREDLCRHRQMLDALLEHGDLEPILSIGSTF